MVYKDTLISTIVDRLRPNIPRRVYKDTLISTIVDTYVVLQQAVSIKTL